MPEWSILDPSPIVGCQYPLFNQLGLWDPPFLSHLRHPPRGNSEWGGGGVYVRFLYTNRSTCSEMCDTRKLSSRAYHGIYRSWHHPSMVSHPLNNSQPALSKLQHTFQSTNDENSLLHGKCLSTQNRTISYILTWLA